jgi:hypothetical protein
LKQYNDRPTLLTKIYKGREGGLGLSFCRDAFSIERIVREKNVSSSFGGAAGLGMRTPGDGASLP